MITIYHNSRCRKSRETLQILVDNNLEFKVVEYLKTQLSKTQIENLINKLGIDPIEIVRKNEDVWKQIYKGKELSGSEIAQIIYENPKLIERPIVELNDKAIIGRPPENVLKII